MSQDDGRRDGPVAAQAGPRDRSQDGPRRSHGGGASELVTPGGRTAIADVVVAKIAGMAAREVGGVHEMGAGMSRTVGSVKERLPGVAANPTQGVGVQVGERQAAIDIDLVVDYGASIPDLAGAVRSNVIGQVEHMCGLEVVEVDITVDDIHLPDDDDGEPEQPTGPRVI